MPKTEPKTKVIFRMEGRGKNAACVALFPRDAGTNDPYTCSCYAHLGQHASASPEYMRRSVPATPEQYADLKRELEAHPYHYKFVIGHRFTRSDYEERERQVRR